MPFQREPQKLVRHTQTIRRQQSTICLSVFDDSVELSLKGLLYAYNFNESQSIYAYKRYQI